MPAIPIRCRWNKFLSTQESCVTDCAARILNGDHTRGRPAAALTPAQEHEPCPPGCHPAGSSVGAGRSRKPFTVWIFCGTKNLRWQHLIGQFIRNQRENRLGFNIARDNERVKTAKREREREGGKERKRGKGKKESAMNK